MNEDEALKQIIYKDIYKLVKSGKIKSITIDDKIFDLRNIPEDGYKYNVKISKKYIPLLGEYDIKHVLSFLNTEEYNLVMITKDNKFIGLKNSHHSSLQFIKRFLYVFLIDQQAFEFNKNILSIFEEYRDYFIKILFSKATDIGNDKKIIECMKKILEESSYFNEFTTGRLRDKIAFKDRENAVRYFTHPFLFIVEDEILKTVELYSSSFDFRTHNKITKNTESFRRWVKKRLKGDLV